MGLLGVGGGEPSFRGFAGGDVARSIKVFQPVTHRGPAGRVFVQPSLNPLLDSVGLEVLRHVFGFVDGVHEGDARLDVHFPALGGAAHRQREGQTADVIRGRQLAAPFALGRLGQLVRRLVCIGVVDTNGDDAVVGQPAVADGFLVAFAVQLHAEGGFVVH